MADEEPTTCNHPALELDCPVCRLFMEDPDEDWSRFEATPDPFEG